MVLIPASSLQPIWVSELQLHNQGSWGPPLLGAGSLYSILSPTNSTLLFTELYYCFTPTQFNLSTVSVIPLIPSTRCTCYLHRCISYFDSSIGVNMQHFFIKIQLHISEQVKKWQIIYDLLNAENKSKNSEITRFSSWAPFKPRP